MGRKNRGWSLRWMLGAALVASGVLAVTGGAAGGSPAAGAANAGCDKLWAAPLSGDWGDPSDWSPAGVPTNTDNVCISAAGSYTVTASSGEMANSLTLGGAGSSPTLSLDPGDGVTMSGASTIEAGSTVTLVPSGGGSYLNGHATLTNDGTITVPATRTLAISELGVLSFVNEAKGSITDNGMVTVGGAFTDRGPITVGASGTWVVGEYSPFIHAAGVITNSGSFATSGNRFLNFVQSGGSIKGNPISLRATNLIDSGGTGAIQLSSNGVGNDVLTGTIPAGQTVSVPAGLNLGSATLTNDGTLECTGTNKGASNVIDAGTSIENDGTFAVAAGAACNLEVPLSNTATGKVEVAGTIALFAPVVNDGVFRVAETGSLLNLGAVPPATFTNDPSGTVTNDGGFELTATTFTSDGALRGTQPITLINTNLDDQSGAGAFLIYGTSIVSGTVPTGQTLAVRGTVTYAGGSLSLGGATLTNDGTITLGTVAGNGNSAGITTGGAGGSLVNNGTIVLLAPPSGFSADDVLDAPIHNTSSGTILVLSPTAYLGYPYGTGSGVTLTNDGTLTFAAGAQLILEGGDAKPIQGSSIVMGATSILNFTVDVEAGAPVPVAAIVQGAYGPVGSLVLGGTFSITTLGAPAVSIDFSVLAGIDITGGFAGLEFGIRAYTLTTTSTSVSVKTAKPFTLTPKSVSGTAGQSLHATLATLHGSGTGTCRVSVAWGDGSSSSGTFTASTGGGTVGGVHTYVAAGSYTIATTVSCANGTTRKTDSTATIAS